MQPDIWTRCSQCQEEYNVRVTSCNHWHQNLDRNIAPTLPCYIGKQTLLLVICDLTKKSVTFRYSTTPWQACFNGHKTWTTKKNGITDIMFDSECHDCNWLKWHKRSLYVCVEPWYFSLLSRMSMMFQLWICDSHQRKKKELKSVLKWEIVMQNMTFLTFEIFL